MSDLLAHLAAWWRGGDLLMPVMLGVALVLYTLLAERTIVLLSVRRHRRSDELLNLLGAAHPDTDADHRWRAWAARYVGLAEADHLSRGRTLIRTLTACLPLLGLLGTVMGMIDPFSALAMVAPSSVQARQTGAGIGLALTATQYGMALAIPAVLWEWALGRRIAVLIDHREQVVRRSHDLPHLSASVVAASVIP